MCQASFKQQQKCVLLIVLLGTFLILFKIYVFSNQFASVGKMCPSYKCPDVHVITVREGGQLANNIWEYMSLLSVMRLYEDKLEFAPYISKMLKGKMKNVFERVNVSEISKIPSSCLTCLMREPYVLRVNESFDSSELLVNTKRVLILDQYSARYREVLQYGIYNIKKELRFHKRYIEYSNTVFDQIKKASNMSQDNVTYIGMHYRGNDYVPFLERNYKNLFSGPPNAAYYTKAMKYFKEKYEMAVFILITVDYQWLVDNLLILQNNFTLIVNPNERDPVKDLALLSHCNHSIINYGTYGTTAALFVGGTTFVYDLGLPLDQRGPTIATGIARILPNWHLLR